MTIRFCSSGVEEKCSTILICFVHFAMLGGMGCGDRAVDRALLQEPARREHPETGGHVARLDVVNHRRRRRRRTQHVALGALLHLVSLSSWVPSPSSSSSYCPSAQFFFFDKRTRKEN